MPEQEAGEGPIASARRLVTKPALQQRIQKRLDDREASERWSQPGCCGMPGRHEWEDLRVFQGDVSYGVGEALQVMLPAVAGAQPEVRVGLEGSRDGSDDAVEEV